MLDLATIKNALVSPGLGEKLGAALTSLLDVYISDGDQGAKELAHALDEVLEGLKNKKDPLLKSLGPMDAMALWAATNPFKHMKEDAKRARQEKSAD